MNLIKMCSNFQTENLKTFYKKKLNAFLNQKFRTKYRAHFRLTNPNKAD